jgi:hypothetical protein
MKRAPGHPPLDDEDDSVPVCVKMPSKQYDDAYKRAKHARVSVPEQIRRDMREAEKRNPK